MSWAWLGSAMIGSAGLFSAGIGLGDRAWLNLVGSAEMGTAALVSPGLTPLESAALGSFRLGLGLLVSAETDY